jgi:hypothetical protein
MPEDPISNKQRLTELIETGEAIGKLAENEDAFKNVVKAYQAQDAERFQAELVAIGLLERCRLICRWLCIKHCGIICLKLAGPEKPQDQVDLGEIREFAEVAGHLSKNEAQLKELIEIVDREDVKAYRAFVKRLKLERFSHQLCRWICAFRCRLICELLCPPPPLLTKVGYIPTTQIDAQGYAAGPSIPPGTTPADDKPNGVGDHPFGGLANIRGVFNIAAPNQYRVEFGPSATGPWTPIVQTVSDYRFNPAWPNPGEPIFLYYNRVPTADGWYTISEMGLAGADYLTDWPTPAGANDLHYLRLSVRTAALTEFHSPIVPARVDNVAPTKPSISLQLQAPDGSRTALGCCEEVKQGKGNLVVVTLQASDANFSRISVRLLGGCGSGFSIIDTGGTPLSKTYNGDVTDTGYPAAKEFLWDPWAAGIDPCCYLVHVRIWDRAIVNNSWSGGHTNVNWHSITIA